MKNKETTHTEEAFKKHLSEQMAKKNNGELFNVFTILKLFNKELSHSLMIAGLADPRGDHGHGEKFLNNLIAHLGIDNNEFKLDLKKCITTTEKGIGAKNQNEETGGRMDIIFEDGENAIIIENKIFAPDQENQLIRYSNYAKKYKNHRLIYLNLTENPPSEISVKGQKNDLKYAVCTYRDNILPWLKDCLTAAKDQPLLRETLVQYIGLLEHLPGNREKTQKNDFLILKEKWQDGIKKEIIAHLENSPSLKDEFLIKDNDKNRYSPIFMQAKSPKNGHVFFGVESFKADNRENLFCGIFHNRNEDSATGTQEVKEMMDSHQIVPSDDGFWYGKQYLSALENHKIDLNDLHFLDFLVNNKDDKREKLVNHIVQEIERYINTYRDIILIK